MWARRTAPGTDPMSTRAHSNRKTNRIWAPNVQNVRVVVNGTAKRMNVCTSCLRSGNVTRALPRTRKEA